MLDEEPRSDDGAAEELLRRALLDDSAAVAVSLRVDGLPLSEAVTVIFHARRDLGTLQTYVAPGSRGAGATVAASELLRVPCDLDLADAEDREDAERLYGEQARALRDALVGADVVLDVWREPLADFLGADVQIDHSVQLSVRLPAARLLPTALVAPRRPRSSSRRCAALARWRRGSRRWGSPAPSRTSPACIRWPMIPSGAWRSSSSSPPPMRASSAPGSITRRRRSSASSS